MRVNDSNFKTNTLGETAVATPEEQQQVEDGLVEDFFEEGLGAGPAGSDEALSDNPIDDYTSGATQDGRVKSFEGDAAAGWLADFPPTPEDVIAKNEHAIEYLDILMQRYDKAKGDLAALCKSYEDALAGGQLAAAEMQGARAKLELAKTAMARCDEYQERIVTLSDKNENIYVKELADMQDYNNDNFIGRYGKGIGVYENDDGTTTYFDPESQRAIPNPLMDPEYTAKLTNDGALKKIEKAEARNATETDTVDMYLQLTPESLTHYSDDNIYQTPIDIGVPEYIWVEKAGKDSWEPKFDKNEEEQQNKMVVYNNWFAEGGIVQQPPADKSNYMQMQVTEVKVSSVDSGLKSKDGTQLWHTMLEFYHGDDLIMRTRIEGFASNVKTPAGVDTSGSVKNYVAASTVGLTFHGADRASPIIIDTEGYHPTGRHTVDNLATKIGIRDNGSSAFEANMAAFKENEKFVYNADGTRYHDAFVSDGDTATKNGAKVLKNRTGIFVRDFMSGDITGVQGANNVIWTRGIDWESNYAKEHLPKNRKKIKKDDPFFANRVEAYDGSNIMVAGHGDNYLFGATLAWVDAKANDDHFISTPEVGPNPEGDGEKDPQNLTTTNPSVFVHVTGGHARIYNPLEDPEGIKGNQAAENTPKNPEKATREQNAKDKGDDCYDIGSSATASFFIPSGEDLDVPVGYGRDDDGTDFATMDKAADEPMGKFRDELTKVPEIDESKIQATMSEVAKESTGLSDEMNGFFDEMFGEAEDDFNSIDGEAEAGIGEAELKL